MGSALAVLNYLNCHMYIQDIPSPGNVSLKRGKELSILKNDNRIEIRFLFNKNLFSSRILLISEATSSRSEEPPIFILCLHQNLRPRVIYNGPSTSFMSVYTE